MNQTMLASFTVWNAEDNVISVKCLHCGAEVYRNHRADVLFSLAFAAKGHYEKGC